MIENHRKQNRMLKEQIDCNLQQFAFERICMF